MTDDSAGRSPAAHDELSRTLAGAFAASVALLGALGAATGGLARLQRNGGWWVGAALALLVLAVAAGLGSALLRRGSRSTGLLALGVVSFVAAMGLSATASYRLAGERDRPRLTAAWKTTEDPMVLQVTAAASGLGLDDRLSVLVSAPGVGQLLYSGETGPDADGVAEQSAEVFVPRNPRTDAVQISGYVGDVYAGCGGQAYAWSSVRGARSVPAPVSGRTVRPACLSLRAVPGPAPATPTARPQP